MQSVVAAGVATSSVSSSREADPWILVLATLLILIGSSFVFGITFQANIGGSYGMLFRHLVSIVLGAGVAVVCSRISWQKMHRAAPKLFGFTLFLLVAVLLVGREVNGATRWLDFVVLRFQPAELAKIAFVLMAARVLCDRKEKILTVREGVFHTAGLLGALGVLLALQPDAGSVALIAGVGIGMIFLSGVPILHTTVLIGLASAVAWQQIVMYEWRLERWNTFVEVVRTGIVPDIHGSGWQLHNAMVAFGSGGTWGLGLGQSRQKAGYLPEAHTDFIFAVIGEETGLFGATVLLAGFIALALRGFRIAHQHKSPYAQMVAAGLTLLLSLQVLLNAGVTLGLLPTKGMGLPLISYGGSSMIIYLAVIGLLISLSRDLGDA